MVCLSRTHFFIKTYFHKNNEAAISKKEEQINTILRFGSSKAKNNK